jgi:hypothetical protein
MQDPEISFTAMQSFAFLYVLIPAGPGSIVMAMLYQLDQRYIVQTAGSLLLSTLLRYAHALIWGQRGLPVMRLLMFCCCCSAPLMFIGIGLLNVDPHSDTWHTTIRLTQDIIGGLSLAGTSYMLLSFALTLKWRPLLDYICRCFSGGSNGGHVGAGSVEALVEAMCGVVDVQGAEGGGGMAARQIQGVGQQQEGTLRRRAVHRYPVVHLVLLALAQWLFFAFRHGSTVETLEFKRSTPMNGADFFCLLGGFVRSFMCPVILYQLQSGQGGVTWPYVLVWGCSFVLATIVMLANTTAANSDGFVWTKVLWDSAGLLLMGYSLVRLVASTEPTSVLLGDSVYFRLLQLCLYYTVYTSVNLTYHVYAQLLHSDGAYLGAAHTLLFLRIVLGYGTGLIVALTFGFEPELTQWWMVRVRWGARLLGSVCGGISLKLTALSTVPTNTEAAVGAGMGSRHESNGDGSGSSANEKDQKGGSAELPPQLASSAFPEPLTMSSEATVVHASAAAI